MGGRERWRPQEGAGPGSGQSPAQASPRPSASRLSTPTFSFKLRTEQPPPGNESNKLQKKTLGVSTWCGGDPEPEMEMTLLALKRVVLSPSGGMGSKPRGGADLPPAFPGRWTDRGQRGTNAGLPLKTPDHQPRAAGSAHKSQEDTAHPRPSQASEDLAGPAVDASHPRDQPGQQRTSGKGQSWLHLTVRASERRIRSSLRTQGAAARPRMVSPSPWIQGAFMAPCSPPCTSLKLHICLSKTIY